MASRSLAAGGALAMAAIACAPGILAQTGDPGAGQTAPAAGTAQTPGTPGQGGRRGQNAGMGRASGEVTAVAGNTLTVKGEDGQSMQVVLTDNTRVMKDRGAVKVSDLHAGDGLMAFGNLDPATHTLHAAMVMATDAAELKTMRDNLGKTYITGRVTAINLDDAKMTVERPDHVAQTIGFDETTSFKRAVRPQREANGAGGGAAGGEGGEARAGGGGGMGAMGMGGGMGAMAGGGAMMDRAFTNAESITLADIKVGDTVTGTGTVKGGVFVPAKLLEMPRRQRPAAGEPGAGAPPNAVPPATGGPGSR